MVAPLVRLARANHSWSRADGRLRAADATNTTTSSFTAEHRGRWRWLMATALACADRQAVAEIRSFISQYASPRLHVWVNAFDAEAKAELFVSCSEALLNAATGSTDGLVHVSRQAGHKTLFWRRELTPPVVSRYDVIWLLDCDVRVSSHLFSFREVEHWMHVTGASIVQPSVIPLKSGGRAGRASFTRTALSADCVVRETPSIEQMTPILRRGAFERVWAALATVPDLYLGSDSGLETLWCGLATRHFPLWPACALLNTQSVVHLNTHTIHKYDKLEREHCTRRADLHPLAPPHERASCSSENALEPASIAEPSGNYPLRVWQTLGSSTCTPTFRLTLKTRFEPPSAQGRSRLAMRRTFLRLDCRKKAPSLSGTAEDRG